MEIENSMKLIEDGINGYFYSHNNGYEIMYGRGFSWRLRPINKGDWEEFNIDSSINIFNKNQLNLYQFQTELYNTLLDQAVYLTTRLENIEKQTGKSAIKERVEAWKSFGQSLAKVIEKTFKKKTIKLL